MRGLAGKRPTYTRAERASDAAVHVTGLAAAVIAVPVMVTLAVLWRGDAGTVVAALVYGATMIAMLACSAIYNITHGSPWTDVLKRLDHSAIYFKIAGTYTPFAILSGAQVGYLLVALWSAAGIGAAMKIIAPYRFKLFGIGLCLAMGWAGVFIAEDLVANLAPEVFGLMLLGGALYTLGVVFFLWASLPFHNTIWHVFVLTATGVFYAAVLVQLGQVPAGPPSDPALLRSAVETG